MPQIKILFFNHLNTKYHIEAYASVTSGVRYWYNIFLCFKCMFRANTG